MSRQASSAVTTALEILEDGLKAAGAWVCRPESESYPSLVAVHPERGLVAIDVADGETDAVVTLNRRVAALRDSVPEVSRVPAARRVVDDKSEASDGSVLTFGDATNLAWLDALPARSTGDDVRAALARYFAPRMTIDIPVRHPLKDAGATERAARRVELDAQQSQLARRDVDRVLAITGPPGSGKTLVLAARAKWLASQHPDWRIQLLCFNRMLVPYLEKLTWGHANVSVSTVGRFAAALGVRMSLDDPFAAERQLAVARRSGLKERFDAILIDEWQDFFPAWTGLAQSVLRPGRGGMVVAGDPKQALYHDFGMGEPALGPIEVAELGRPYRSTRQILDVTSALGDELDVLGRDQAFDGEPVDLVWARNAAGQAAAVTRDVLLLLQSGEREPNDIAVLATRKWEMGRIYTALSSAGVPCRTVYANQADELDLAEKTVKITTVHSAKGLEFDVVFLVGLEHLPDPDGSSDVDRQGRTGYVGATRASDQLVLSYSKDNAYLERIRTLPDETLRRWVWPDDYPEE